MEVSVKERGDLSFWDDCLDKFASGAGLERSGVSGNPESFVLEDGIDDLFSEVFGYAGRVGVEVDGRHTSTCKLF